MNVLTNQPRQDSKEKMFQTSTKLRERENFPDEWKEKKFSGGVEMRVISNIQECFVGELEPEKGFKESQLADGSLQAEVVSTVLEKQVKLAIFWKQSLDQEYIKWWAREKIKKVGHGLD